MRHVFPADGKGIFHVLANDDYCSRFQVITLSSELIIWIFEKNVFFLN